MKLSQTKEITEIKDETLTLALGDDKKISNKLKEIIIDYLQHGQPVYYTSTNHIQHYIRCSFCGDSNNERHGHLSIKIDVNSDAPMVYRCLKCNIRGLVTDTFLEEIGVFLDTESKKDLKSYTKKSMKVAKLVNLDKEKYFVPLSNDSDLCRKKLSYINDRLNTAIDITKAKDYKIILNFYEFLKANDLLEVNEDFLMGLNYSMIKNLHENYIGFLSTNNNCIIFRDITGKQKYRYFKVYINGKNINMDSFFSIPSRVNLIYTNDIHVHVAEGIFDIISIKENIIKTKENQYYYASCGFGCNSIIKYIIHHAMNTGINLHIYSDNDKMDKDHFKYLYNRSYITEWIDHIYFHRNGYNNEKDYGIPLDRIIDTIRKIK